MDDFEEYDDDVKDVDDDLDEEDDDGLDDIDFEDNYKYE